MKKRRAGQTTKPRKRPAYLRDDDALADDLYARRNEPDAASEEPVAIQSRPTGMELVSFRLPSNELDLVEEAAGRIGESISQFVRRSVAMRLGREKVAPFVVWSAGSSGRSNVNLHTTGAMLVTATRNPGVFGEVH